MVSNLTAYDIISKALRLVGVVGQTGSIKASIGQEALMLLNTLRAEWSLNVKNWKKYDQTFTALTNKQFITLGAGGDIATRPNTVTEVVLINSLMGGASNNNYPLSIKPYEDYRSLTVQNIFAMPQTAYPDYEYPLLNIFFNPGLSAGWSIRVLGNSYMTDYENISDQFMDPPEFFNALYLNLALRLAPLYGLEVSVGVQTAAASSIKHIKHHMAQMRRKAMPNQFGGGGSLNFYSGRSS